MVNQTIMNIKELPLSKMINVYVLFKMHYRIKKKKNPEKPKEQLA